MRKRKRTVNRVAALWEQRISGSKNGHLMMDIILCLKSLLINSDMRSIVTTSRLNNDIQLIIEKLLDLRKGCCQKYQQYWNDNYSQDDCKSLLEIVVSIDVLSLVATEI